ncbi:MAG: MFS transporter [Promethearchaeota archaeon]
MEPTSNSNPREGPASRNRVHWWYFMLMMFLNEVFDTYNTTYPDTIPSEVESFFSITTSEYAFYLGIFSLGMYFVFASQVLVDRVGRRKMLFVVFLGYGLSNLFLLFSTSVWEYTAGMFVLYTCFSSDVWTIMVSEEAPPERRGFYISLVLVVGALAVVPVTLARGTLVPVFGWKAMTWFGILAIPVSFLMLRLDETPAYLEIKGGAGRPVVGAPADADADAAHAPADAAPPTGTATGTPAPATGSAKSLKEALKVPFQREYRNPFVVVLASSFVLGMDYLFVKMGEDYLSNQRGFSDADIALVAMVVAASALLGFTITGLLSDRIGRKKTYYLFSALLPTGLAFFTSGSTPLIFVGILLAWMSFWSLTLVSRLVCLEIFPTSVRGTATGWRTLAFALGTTVGAFTTSLLEPAIGLTGVFLLLGALVLVVLPFFALVVKETRSISLTASAKA